MSWLELAPWRLQVQVPRLSMPRARLEDVLSIAWLIIGLLISYIYTGIFTRLFAVSLPHPLSVPQAIILSVLLLTPTGTWWVYLLIYYVMQIVQGVTSDLSLPYVLSSNLANLIEPLIGASLVRLLVA